MGDMSKNAQAKYKVWDLLVMSMDGYTMRKVTPGPFELCKFMKLAQEFTEERRVVNDAFDAYSAIALFFDHSEFLESDAGKAYYNVRKRIQSETGMMPDNEPPSYEVWDQAERAKDVPDRRTHKSNKTMPQAFWKDFEKLLKDNKRVPGEPIDDIYPDEWRVAIRPKIIRCK